MSHGKRCVIACGAVCLPGIVLTDISVVPLGGKLTVRICQRDWSNTERNRIATPIAFGLFYEIVVWEKFGSVDILYTFPLNSLFWTI